MLIKSPMLLPVLTALSFTFVNPCSQKIAQPIQQPLKGEEVFEVEVLYPEFVSIPRTHKVDGEMEESEIHFVTASVEGEIEEITVKEGDVVKEGDILATLSSLDLADLLEVRRSKVKEVEARLKAAKNRAVSDPNPSRPVTNEEVVFLDEGFADEPPPATKSFGLGSGNEPPQNVKDLIDVLEALSSRYASEATLLETRLQDLTQKSPVNGTVIDVMFSSGNKLREQDKIVAIARTDPMSVAFDLPKDVASFIDKHSKVYISLEDAPDVESEGSVDFISPDIDAGSGNIRVRASIANPDGRIKGGQRAKVRVETTKMDRMLVLPEKAIVYEGGKRYLFVVYGNQSRLIEVTTGRKQEDGRIEVEGADIRMDDPIVVNRPIELKNNSFVKIIKESHGDLPKDKSADVSGDQT